MSYCANRMNRALEERIEILARENNDLKDKVSKMYADYDAAVLRQSIKKIDTYDKQVQQIIAASPILSEAWDNFRVQYQLTASKELLQTAKEKIAGRATGVCHGCGQKVRKE